MRKNGFKLQMEFWKRRYCTTISRNSKLRKDYDTVIPTVMALCNIKEITKQSIPKILWRLETFHGEMYSKLIKNKSNLVDKWLEIFIGYHMHNVQQRSNAAYARKMTKR